MALGNHILTITEPTIKLDELEFESFNEEGGDNNTSRGYGFDGTPFIMINGYDFRDEAIMGGYLSKTIPIFFGIWIVRFKNYDLKFIELIF